MFHINNQNQLKPCKAKLGNCRFIQCTSEYQANFILAQITEIENEYSIIQKSKTQHTTSLLEIASKYAGEMVGLEYSLKTLESVKQKIILRHGANLVLDLYDVCRYTIQFSTSELPKKTESVLIELSNRGYKFIAINNYFETVGYKGINIKLEDKNFNKLELQIHTPESSEAKAKAHKIYEKARLLSEGTSKYKKLDKQMLSIFNFVPLPDLEELKSVLSKFTNS